MFLRVWLMMMEEGNIRLAILVTGLIMVWKHRAENTVHSARRREVLNQPERNSFVCHVGIMQCHVLLFHVTSHHILSCHVAMIDIPCKVHASWFAFDLASQLFVSWFVYGFSYWDTVSLHQSNCDQVCKTECWNFIHHHLHWWDYWEVCFESTLFVMF